MLLKIWLEFLVSALSRAQIDKLPPSLQAPEDEFNRQQKSNLTVFNVCVVIGGVKHQHMPRPERTAGERVGGGKEGKKDSARNKKC